MRVPPVQTSARLIAFAVALSWTFPLFADELQPRQASGVKVGEITDSSAIVWMRLTKAPQRNETGEKISGRYVRNNPQQAPADPDELHAACPGAAGRVRVRYAATEDLRDAVATPWMDVDETTDFMHQFALADLNPATTYYYAAETAGPEGEPAHGAVRGQFETAPPREAATEVRCCVLSCQAFRDLDDPEGFKIYPAMLAQHPQFVVFTGDNVYYDSEEPRAVTPALARYHWQRMYSLPRHVELLRRVGSYWEKDDHDVLSDDSWPGTQMGDLTYEEGQRIFRQQVPIGQSIYRSFRWGKSLEIWLTDGRDFRSPNRTPDGPEKTIWGAEQKEWFKRTVAASDATWKLLISPTPLVGPDRGNKADNHANAVYQHEGDELRTWMREHAPENLFVVCGDRHWQYHSVHPQTGLNEYSVGAASDEHASGSPGEDKEYHRFHRVKGGFLSIVADPQQIVFTHRDVNGDAVYENRHVR